VPAINNVGVLSRMGGQTSARLPSIPASFSVVALKPQRLLLILRVFTACSYKTRIIKIPVKLRSDAHLGDAPEYDPARRRDDGLART
jgi:hypothetical protein